jgi:hypothetical protein
MGALQKDISKIGGSPIETSSLVRASQKQSFHYALRLREQAKGLILSNVGRRASAQAHLGSAWFGMVADISSDSIQCFSDPHQPVEQRRPLLLLHALRAEATSSWSTGDV